MLDRHFEPKIGDFGLARSGPKDQIMSYKSVSRIQGKDTNRKIRTKFFIDYCV